MKPISLLKWLENCDRRSAWVASAREGPNARVPTCPVRRGSGR